MPTLLYVCKYCNLNTKIISKCFQQQLKKNVKRKKYFREILQIKYFNFKYIKPFKYKTSSS